MPNAASPGTKLNHKSFKHARIHVVNFRKLQNNLIYILNIFQTVNYRIQGTLTLYLKPLWILMLWRE